MTGPGGVAAWLTRRPLVIHEQNAIAGYSNRCLAHLARRVLAAFPEAFPPGIEARVVGNPVRAEIVMQPPPATRFARARGRAAPPRGRRQSGRRATECGGAVRASTKSGLSLRVRHQAGERGIDAARSGVRRGGCDGAMSRRSSMTWRAPMPTRTSSSAAPARSPSPSSPRSAWRAVLVPFPAAVDDHQTCQCAIPGARRRRRADRGSRTDGGAARRRAR